MPSRAQLERLYGPDGADLLQAASGTGIATNSDGPFHVHFRGNRAVTDDTLRIVGRLVQLQEVVANGTSITDTGLAHLGALSNLRLLHLNQTQISDAGLVHLETLPLEMLDLCHTHVTGVGLQRLQHIRTLNKVWIVGCGCSAESIALLRSTLPNCQVIETAGSMGD